MADHSDESLIREINDELREEQLHKLWKRFGGYIVGAAVLVVAVVAGYQGWNYYITSARNSEGERFHSAELVAASGNLSEALAAMQGLGNDGVSGYRVLARFQEAALQGQQGNPAQAAATFLAIADANTADPATSGLAVILGALQSLEAGGGDWAELDRRLGNISQDGSPWRYSARELMALVALETGDRTRAKALLTALAADRTAPDGVGRRAGIVLKQLND